MATVVHFASCYASGQLFGRGTRGGNYLALLSPRGPHYAPRPRLACHAPRMTLRQICRMLKLMKQVRNREAAAAAAAARKQPPAAAAAAAAAVATPASPAIRSEKRCVPSCLKRKRSVKRVG